MNKLNPVKGTKFMCKKFQRLSQKICRIL